MIGPAGTGVAVDFIRRGEDLLRMAAGLARATDGRFNGPAAEAALGATVAYAQAAASGLAALASISVVRDPERLALGQAASAFRNALGAFASRFAGGDTVLSLADLGRPAARGTQRLAGFFDAAAPFVSVSVSAQTALVGLARDPAELAELGSEQVLGSMAAAAAGVTLAEGFR